MLQHMLQLELLKYFCLRLKIKESNISFEPGHP